MSVPPYSSTSSYSLSERLDETIEWLMIALLAFMPLAFGAVQAWSEQVVIFGAAAVSICFLVKVVVRERTALVWSWSYVPVVLFLLVALIQLVSLPVSLLSAISPATVQIKQELLSGVANSTGLGSSAKLSFYPQATVHDLRIVFAVAAVFCVVLNVYRRTDQIKRLLTAIAIIGGAIAVLGLLQRISGTSRIYWTVPTVENRYWFGTFILHSHYSQFMNLSIGATLALVLVILQERFGGKPITPVVVSEYFSSSESRFVWVLIGIVVIGAATVILSLSRAGMISLLIAGSFTAVVLTSRRSLKGSGWAIALIALCAFMCVLYVGFDAVYDRLGSLDDLQKASGGRMQILKDLCVSFKKFPVLGTGLGTHEVVYPMFERSTIPDLAAHAENEYAQAAEEMGLTGLGALIAFAIIVWFGYVRNIRSESIPIRSAAYGLGAGLLAVMIHSLSDFGQHLPANAMLSAVFCALLLGLGRMGKEYRSRNNTFRSGRIPKAVRIGALVAVACLWIVVLAGSNSTRAAEGYWKQARLSEKVLGARNWRGSNAEYKVLISNAVKATERQPGNIKYHHWLSVYRWQSVSRSSDPNTGEILMNDLTARFTKDIADDLKEAIAICPTYGPTWCVAGQLDKFVLDKPEGAQLIRTGYRLAPCNSTACFVAGYLDAKEGSIEDSYSKFERALQLDNGLFEDVADVYINQLERPDLAVAIAAGKTGRLSRVAAILSQSDAHQELADQARAKVTELLEAKCDEPDVPATVFAALGYVYYKDNRQAEAIDCFRRGLALDYGQVDWRLTLAKLLADTDRTSDAIHEARICLRLNPQLKPAEKLIAQLSVRVDGGDTKSP